MIQNDRIRTMNQLLWRILIFLKHTRYTHLIRSFMNPQAVEDVYPAMENKIFIDWDKAPAYFNVLVTGNVDMNHDTRKRIMDRFALALDYHTAVHKSKQKHRESLLTPIPHAQAKEFVLMDKETNLVELVPGTDQPRLRMTEWTLDMLDTRKMDRLGYHAIVFYVQFIDHVLPENVMQAIQDMSEKFYVLLVLQHSMHATRALLKNTFQDVENMVIRVDEDQDTLAQLETMPMEALYHRLVQAHDFVERRREHDKKHHQRRLFRFVVLFLILVMVIALVMDMWLLGDHFGIQPHLDPLMEQIAKQVVRVSEQVAPQWISEELRRRLCPVLAKPIPPPSPTESIVNTLFSWINVLQIVAE